MSSVVISGDTSGAITLSAPAVAGTNTITLPAATGTIQVSGNMPAFSAYLGSAQSISAGATTKVQCNTEEFDTNSNYDTSTYRFTPTVAGYYQVNCAAQDSGTSTTLQINIYKNGSLTKKSSYSAAITYYACTASALIYCNGTTDYLEFYIYSSATSALSTGTLSTYFQASLARSA